MRNESTSSNSDALGSAHLYRGQLPRYCNLEDFSWHSHAGRSNSSQVACINAFGHTADLDGGVGNKVFGDFFSAAFPEMATKARRRRWTVELEYEDPSLLNEYGTRQPTSIDAFCTTSTDVVAVEAKFDRDAMDGFGCCSQPKAKACAGHHGPGSDLRTGANVDCRLEAWDRNRSPRLYWVLGKQYFQQSALQPQEEGVSCPLSGPSYQLMRNFLFAASYAIRERKRNFGVAVVCPKRRRETLSTQLEQFRDSILLPEYRDRIQLLTYDYLIDLLRNHLPKDERSLSDHLTSQLDQLD